MVIDKIGNINNITDTGKSKPLSKSKKSEKNDSIQISSEGKKAADTARVSQIVQETPNIRAERVQALKQQIADGTYDFDDHKVLELVADKIASFLLR